MQTLRAALLLLLFCTPLHAAPRTYKVDLFLSDARISAELEKIGYHLLSSLDWAKSSQMEGEHAKASVQYAQLIEQAPSFSHAYRGRAESELALGHRDVALTLQRRAVELAKIPENYAFLAFALAATENISEAERTEATAAIESGLSSGSCDIPTLFVLSDAALRLGNVEQLDRTSAMLVNIADGEAGSHYFRAWALGMKGEIEEGRRAMETSRLRGLPLEALTVLRAAYEGSRPLYQKVAIWTGWIVAPWAAGLAILFVSGVILSHLALRASSELPLDESGRSTAFGQQLRQTYAMIISIAAAYYYISIPVVALLTIGAAAALILGLLAAGWLPVKLVVIAVVVGGVSVVGLIRGVFVKFANDDPGIKLDLNEHPKFRQVLDEVAERIRTRAVDSVYLTPETDVAVMERTTSDKREERCLILGVGVLDGFQLQSFKAVLGHEYGHLVNRDTAGGDVAIAVRSRIFKTARHIAEGGAATWYNPAWLFLRGFDSLFLKISQGASRFQEVMADRWAAFAYGSDHFEKGLRHAIARSVEFDVYSNARLKDVVENREPLVNLYEGAATDDGDTQTLVAEAFDRETSPYDSHPSYRDRVAWVRALNAPGTQPATEEADVWSLFNDREALQRRMTNVVRENVRVNYGVDIPQSVEAVVAS